MRGFFLGVDMNAILAQMMLEDLSEEGGSGDAPT